MTDRDIMQQARDAMGRYQVKRQDFDTFANEITTLNDRLAQPEQEPVAWLHPANATCVTTDPTAYARGIPLYTNQPAAPMTEFEEAVAACDNTLHHAIDHWQDRALKAEALLARPAQELVSMRMPKAGDKVICLEDESLATVVSLTAGGSPDIVFSDGSRGTYLLHEFAELFGYVTPPAAQPAMFGPMGTVGDLFDKHVIANGNLKKEWIVYLERNT